MSNNEILEANKLIANFMGVEIGKELYSWRIGCTEPLRSDHLAYDKSWGWLMPVVEKIESLNVKVFGDEIKYFAFTIQNKYCIIMGHTNVRQPGCYYQTPYGFVPDSKIHAVWLAVNEFLEWYNKNVEVNNVLPKNDMQCGVGKNNI